MFRRQPIFLRRLLVNLAPGTGSYNAVRVNGHKYMYVCSGF